MPLSAVGGRRMSWGEALRLTRVLCRDPSSQVGAAVAGLSHPVTWDAVVLMDLYDLTQARVAKRRPKPYPRPWSTRKRTRPDGALSQEQIVEALRRAGHMGAIPVREEEVRRG